MALIAEDQGRFFSELFGVKERYAVLVAILVSIISIVAIPALISVSLYFARMWWWIIKNPRKLIRNANFRRLGIDLLILMIALSALILCALLINSGNHSHLLGLGTLLLFLFICFWCMSTLFQFLKVFDNMAGEFQFLEDG